MNKKHRAELETRLGSAFACGAYRHPLETDQRSADYAAQILGLEGDHVALEALTRKLVRWHDQTSRIGWCHFTFNPWVGCVKVSPECKFCYAEDWASRFGRKVWGRKADRPISKGWEAKLRAWRRMAEDPMWRHEFGLRRGERPRIFCGSLMDWAEARDDLQRMAVARAFELIRENDWADFLLLTKRPQNVAPLLPADWAEGYRNVWLGVSIGTGDPSVIDAETRLPVISRGPAILRVPAAVHFLSYEPAIGPLAEAIRPYLYGTAPSLTSYGIEPGRRAFSWSIYGGESGPNFRPEGVPGDPKLWAREMRDVCQEADVAFFHKQSAHRFNERGQELDGELIQQYPNPNA